MPKVRLLKDIFTGTFPFTAVWYNPKCTHHGRTIVALGHHPHKDGTFKHNSAGIGELYSNPAAGYGWLTPEEFSAATAEQAEPKDNRSVTDKFMDLCKHLEHVEAEPIPAKQYGLMWKRECV